MDGSGVHCGVTNQHDVILDTKDHKVEFPNKLELNQKILNNFKQHYSPKTFKGKIRRFLIRLGIFDKVKKILGR
jgi:hypothetical protein